MISVSDNSETQLRGFAACILVAGGSFTRINAVWLGLTSNQWQNRNMARVGKRNGKLKEATHMRARDAELNICNTVLIPGQHVTKSHVLVLLYVNLQ